MLPWNSRSLKLLGGGDQHSGGFQLESHQGRGEPNHAGNPGGKSVGRTRTALTKGTVRVDIIGSSFGTLVAGYSGNSVSNLTLVASDNYSYGSSRSNSLLAHLRLQQKS